jgi:endonuclease I
MKIRSNIIIFILWMVVVAAASAQAPSGYYDQAANLTGKQLKTTLQKIIRGHTRRTYDNLWTDFYSTDDKPDKTVWDIYSDIPDGTPNGNPPYVFEFGASPGNQCATTPGIEGVCYNREHTFPKSWWGGGTAAADTMYTDLFHLYPTDSKVNSLRNNNPYGKVTTATWTSQNGSKLGTCSIPGYSGVAFEPPDVYKGDLARNYFYLATRYENRIAAWKALSSDGGVVLDGSSFPCFEPWFLKMLLEWNILDPVSQKEIDRNNAVFAIQHNRNPYIDHPEYVTAVWGSVDYTGIPVIHSIIKGNAFMSDGYVHISVPSMEGKQVEIGIFDTLGKPILKTRRLMSDRVKVHVSPAPGIYVIRVHSGEDFFETKCVVSRK